MCLAFPTAPLQSGTVSLPLQLHICVPSYPVFPEASVRYFLQPGAHTGRRRTSRASGINCCASFLHLLLCTQEAPRVKLASDSSLVTLPAISSVFKKHNRREVQQSRNEAKAKTCFQMWFHFSKWEWSLKINQEKETERKVTRIKSEKILQLF